MGLHSGEANLISWSVQYDHSLLLTTPPEIKLPRKPSISTYVKMIDRRFRNRRSAKIIVRAIRYHFFYLSFSLQSDSTGSARAAVAYRLGQRRDPVRTLRRSANVSHLGRVDNGKARATR